MINKILYAAFFFIACAAGVFDQRQNTTWYFRVLISAIITAVLLMYALSSPLFAITNVDFAYNQMETNGAIKFTKAITLEMESVTDNMRLMFNSNFKDTEQGTAFENSASSHLELLPDFDMWCGIDYSDNEILAIKDRLDLKIGAGFKFVHTDKRQTKLSYGVVKRDSTLLHSLRLKDKYTYLMFNYAFTIDYLMPMTNKEIGNELRAKIKLFVKMFGVTPSLSFEYAKTESKKYFDTVAGIGVSF